jgi:hypothetical protein
MKAFTTTLVIALLASTTLFAGETKTRCYPRTWCSGEAKHLHLFHTKAAIDWTLARTVARADARRESRQECGNSSLGRHHLRTNVTCGSAYLSTDRYSWKKVCVKCTAEATFECR